MVPGFTHGVLNQVGEPVHQPVVVRHHTGAIDHQEVVDNRLNEVGRRRANRRAPAGEEVEEAGVREAAAGGVRQDIGSFVIEVLQEELGQAPEGGRVFRVAPVFHLESVRGQAFERGLKVKVSFGIAAALLGNPDPLEADRVRDTFLESIAQRSEREQAEAEVHQVRQGEWGWCGRGWAAFRGRRASGRQ